MNDNRAEQVRAMQDLLSDTKPVDEAANFLRIVSCEDAPQKVDHGFHEKPKRSAPNGFREQSFTAYHVPIRGNKLAKKMARRAAKQGLHLRPPLKERLRQSREAEQRYREASTTHVDSTSKPSREERTMDEFCRMYGDAEGKHFLKGMDLAAGKDIESVQIIVESPTGRTALTADEWLKRVKAGLGVGERVFILDSTGSESQIVPDPERVMKAVTVNADYRALEQRMLDSVGLPMDIVRDGTNADSAKQDMAKIGNSSLKELMSQFVKTSASNTEGM